MTSTWLLAMLCVALMGFAIQRGATCTVAAVDEVLTRRRADRLLAMLEASLWVAGGLALGALAHLRGSMPAGFPASAWSVAGGVVLGMGAWLNGACVFGAVARLGSGEWAYGATPFGYFLGCLSVMPLFARPAAQMVPSAPAAGWVLVGGGAAFGLFALWRLMPGLQALRRGESLEAVGAKVWSPHAATVVIGITFVIMLLLTGRWAYTDVLADLAQAMHGLPMNLLLPVWLLVALYAGALVGGRTAGRWQSRWPSGRAVLRCLAGGAVMAWGSLLIPGSNDGLILIGIPLLRPYAWVAFASMFVAIAVAMRVQAWALAPKSEKVPASH